MDGNRSEQLMLSIYRNFIRSVRRNTAYEPDCKLRFIHHMCRVLQDRDRELTGFQVPADDVSG